VGRVGAVRIAIAAPPRNSRTLDERLFVRYPAIYRALSRVVMGLTPGSRLRRALLRRSVASSFAAFARRDFELVLLLFAHDIEYEAPAGAQIVGFSGTIRGRSALAEAYVESVEDLERWEITPEWMLDLRNVLVVLGTSRIRGRESGLELEEEWASVYALRGGLVARQQDLRSWGEALTAVQADPNAVPQALQPRAPGTRAK
jgi:ketosteroid isomerase-like protein